MKPDRLFSHVPRRILNAAVIAGGIAGIVLQAQFRWGIVTTFVITLALCGLCVGIVTLVYRLQRHG
ncbi:MAG TPA: hypothetical protein VMT24_07345 [Aggregatilineaceae bacterium]|jgi:hypothetical protein|nr:hypothetical protein [Aggregatilineaceae bacterium]